MTKAALALMIGASLVMMHLAQTLPPLLRAAFILDGTCLVAAAVIALIPHRRP